MLDVDRRNITLSSIIMMVCAALCDWVMHGPDVRSHTSYHMINRDPLSHTIVIGAYQIPFFLQGVYL